MITQMPEIEIYWVGAATWLVGFLVWLGATYWRPSITLSRIGSVLCWLGFAGTIWPHITTYDNPPFEWPTSLDSRTLTPEVIYSLIRVAWILGFGLLVVSWFRLVPPSVGWAGFVIGMTAVVVSWTEDSYFQVAALISGVLLMLLLFVGAKTSRNRATSRGNYMGRRTRPDDYVAELTLLCHGNRAQVERLIDYETKRHPGFSRQGSARAAVEQLVRDRGGY